MSVEGDFSEFHEYELLFDDNEYVYEESFIDTWNNCVILSVLSLAPTVIPLIGLNFIFGCLSFTGFIPTSVLHAISGCIGVCLVYRLESSTGKQILACCWIISFFLLQLDFYLRKLFRTVHFLKTVLIVLLILSEYYFIQPETWLQIRGIVMILTMKVISLADDIEKLPTKPGLMEYFGYTLCGANSMFGPWVSFSDYLNLYKKPNKKNLIWICAIIKVFCTSLLFLTLSNCWSGYFIGENSNRWLIAYKEAFTFRTSHYFISYLSEASMIAFGFSKSNEKGINEFRYVITEPLQIEFPSSLSVVVKKWNHPMHEFLKKYVYLSWLSHGKFCAILATFLLSSFLHGLELKVSMVLVNIGIFSYLQVAPRDKIAEIFDCCVRVRPCKDCKHKYKRNSIRVKVMLFVYSLATIFHLAYLGVLMDPSTEEVGVYEKWQNLYFASHIVMFFNVMVIS